MADSKISALPASTTPLAGTEVLPIVQSSTTKQVSVANLTAGRAVSALSLTSTTTLGVTGIASIGPNPIAISGAAIDVGNNRNSPTRVGVSNQNSGASATAGIELEAAGGGWKIDVPADTATFVNPLIFSFNTTERMRISGSGLMTVGGGAVIQGLTVGLGANAVGNNVALGVAPLNSASLSGAYNIAIGAYPLFNNTSGTNSVAIGTQALATNTTGYRNTAVGDTALTTNLVGAYNTALGNAALNLSTGNNNLGLGHSAGSALTTGNNNTIIGSVAGTAGLSDTVIIAAGSAERMRINSVGTVLVNQGASVGAYGGQIPIMELYQTSISSADADGGTQVLFGSSAFAIDTGAATTYGFKYNTAGNYATTARVRGAKENATDGNLSGYLAFDTRANGGNITEKLRIDSTGNVIVATAAKGINFTANTGTAGKTSQLLNWYEEGTFTPSDGGGLVIVGTLTFTGTYTRVGRLVTVYITVASTTSVVTQIGGQVCGNLPFTCINPGTGTIINGNANSGVPCLYNGVYVYATGVTTTAASIVMTITYSV